MMLEANVHTCYIEKRLFDKVTITIYKNISFVPYERKNVSAEYLPKSIYDKFESNYSQNEAIVIYSSGTTGKSKGIILSHFAINTNADAILDYMKVGEKACLYIAKAFSHSSVLTGELLVSLKSKTKLVIAPTVVPPRFVLSNIDKFIGNNIAFLGFSEMETVCDDVMINTINKSVLSVPLVLKTFHSDNFNGIDDGEKNSECKLAFYMNGDDEQKHGMFFWKVNLNQNYDINYLELPVNCSMHLFAITLT